MDSERLKQRIRENAEEIVRLRSRIDETYVRRSQSPERMREWKEACTEFHTRYDGLAFPGGYRGGGALVRVAYGDPDAMEAAICFLEIRPYFFRSGYMFKRYSAEMPTSATIVRPSCAIENRRGKAVGVAGTEAGKENVGSAPTSDNRGYQDFGRSSATSALVFLLPLNPATDSGGGQRNG